MSKCENTKVPVGTTYEQIRKMLVKFGVREMAPLERITEKGDVMGVRFVFRLPTNSGKIVPFMFDVPIAYPPNATQVQRGQAERTAWRRLYYWLDANLDLVSDGYVDLVRVLLAWVMLEDGSTVGDHVYQNIEHDLNPLALCLTDRNPGGIQ